MHCVLDLEDMTLGEGQDTPLCHGQILREVISQAKVPVKKYGQHMNFGHICNLTLIFGI